LKEDYFFHDSYGRHWALKTSLEMFVYLDFLIACFLHSLAIAISERRDNHDH